MELETCRAKIDAIDEAILKLIHERMEIAKVIGEIKRTAELPIEDRIREEEILKRLEKLNKGRIDGDQLRKVFKIIICTCLEKQKALNISKSK